MTAATGGSPPRIQGPGFTRQAGQARGVAGGVAGVGPREVTDIKRIIVDTAL